MPTLPDSLWHRQKSPPIPPDRLPEIRRVFERWDIPLAEIGQVTREVEAKIVDETRLLAHLPLQSLTDAPRYRLDGRQSEEQKRRQRLSLSQVHLPDCSPGEILLRLLASPNIASKHSVYRQYDHQVQTNTVVGPGSDAAVLRIKGTAKAIALTIDGNGRYCYLDPYRGGEIAVAEACRNLSCCGAEPLALTDCLNFGNPEKPEIYYQLEQAIRGMARACRVLGVPVVSGNVSLYNESQGQAIFPTPVVGGLGLLEDVRLHARSSFPEEGLLVMLLGSAEWSAKASDLAGGEYLQLMHGLVAGRPYIRLELEKRVQALCRRAIGHGLLASAHDCSDGGLATALAECCMTGAAPISYGLVGSSPANPPGDLVGFRGGQAFSRMPRRWDAALFGEGQSRIVVSLAPGHRAALEHMATESRVPLMELGITGGDRFQLGPMLDLPVREIAEAWGGGLERALAV